MTSQRSRELGIRVALGATPSQVLAATLGRGLVPVLAGVLLGLGAAAALGRLMSSLLFEVTATDPLVYVSVALVLMGVGAVAAFWPARRASRVDPTLVLNAS